MAGDTPAPEVPGPGERMAGRALGIDKNSPTIGAPVMAGDKPSCTREESAAGAPSDAPALSWWVTKKPVMRQINFGLSLGFREIIALHRTDQQDVIPLDIAEIVCKALGMPPNVHQAVRFPHHIGQFRNDVTLDGRPAAQTRDFILQRVKLMHLGRCQQGMKVWK